MKTNYEVALAFNERKSAKNRNMWTNGEILQSYNLTIARWVNGFIEILKASTISNSTSRHFNELWYATNKSWNNDKKRYINACVNNHANLYNAYQLPKEGQIYQRLVSQGYKDNKFCVSSMKKEFDFCDYHKYYGFENYELVIENIVSEKYKIFANYKYDSDKDFVIPEKQIVNAEFKTCEICLGMGFVLTKNYKQKSCKDCSRGVVLCLK